MDRRGSDSCTVCLSAPRPWTSYNPTGEGRDLSNHLLTLQASARAERSSPAETHRHADCPCLLHVTPKHVAFNTLSPRNLTSPTGRRASLPGAPGPRGTSLRHWSDVREALSLPVRVQPCGIRSALVSQLGCAESPISKALPFPGLFLGTMYYRSVLGRSPPCGSIDGRVSRTHITTPYFHSFIRSFLVLRLSNTILA
ncbi:hypothetical protein Zmor_005903 [Zophobas morio]|uniref:Uncharacterized protein n=1 Tax=Zophobas morio TaxID=2755281 RepID=A0AA38MMU9_9CUCU|nr:hypothetical protein Zmor_005903 [Zophobas morio]